MKYLSICSGIEAASVAWESLGWKPTAFSEIDIFPRSVLTYHYPNVPLHGDFTTITKEDYGAVDILIGGTPCQAFSIAGLREGYNDDRGSLTLEFLRLIKRKNPTWVVWENVPGVLSIEQGQCFRQFLAGLGQCGYGYAYRVLDAQYFGVPQRRRRVFLVGYRGDWRPPAKVLFEPESLLGNPKKNKERQVGGTQRRVVSKCLTARGAGGLNSCYRTANYIISLAHTKSNGCGYTKNPTTYTLDASSSSNQAIVNQNIIRRLTPVECERLQGFPDNYTNIPGATDAKRYKALGNSMAVPVIKWIGERIEKVQHKAEELGYE